VLIDRAKYISIRGKVENGRTDGLWKTDNDTDEQSKDRQFPGSITILDKEIAIEQGINA
jgi:hypothetical protein